MAWVINRGTTFTGGMIVGEAPGAEEEEVGKPFVGRSGRLLDSTFEELEDDTNNYYVTNVYKRRPSHNRTPTMAEIQTHLPVLKYEIATIRPKAILSLGNVPLETLTGFRGITKYRGKRLSLKHDLEWASANKQHHTLVVPTFHPAYLLRNPRPYRNFLRDIQEFINLCSTRN